MLISSLLFYKLCSNLALLRRHAPNCRSRRKSQNTTTKLTRYCCSPKQTTAEEALLPWREALLLWREALQSRQPQRRHSYPGRIYIEVLRRIRDTDTDLNSTNISCSLGASSGCPSPAYLPRNGRFSQGGGAAVDASAPPGE